LVHAVEVTEQVRARRRVEETNRLKDEFLATVSHELRTPLTAIVGWSMLLRTNTLDEATVARGLETIERNGKAQAQLIEDLMDVSRIITGKLRLDVQPVELASVIEAAIESAPRGGSESDKA
jgi:signal transduction histidine kinase